MIFRKLTYGRLARKMLAILYKNNQGIALVMVLILSMIALTLMAALLYMITLGTQISGMEKRYKTAVDAGIGGAGISFQVIGVRGHTAFLNLANAGAFSNFNINTSAACVSDKMNLSTVNWANCVADTTSVDINPANANTYDMTFNLGANPTYTVYAKIVDTVRGNSRSDLGLKKGGVVSTNAGEVVAQSRPYIYTIEIQTENVGNTNERGRLSVLYQY
jgi:hypothetical protein